MKPLLAVLLCLPLAAFAVSPGQPAPTTAGPLLSGEAEFGLPSLRGQVVLVDFFASWCGPCAQSLPVLDQLRKELQAQYPGRFEVLAVNVDTDPKDGRKFLRRIPVSYPAISDPDGVIADGWQLPGMPTSFLVDANGVVVLRHEGYRSGDEQKLRAAIQALLGAP